jgi:hypothetical protein
MVVMVVRLRQLRLAPDSVARPPLPNPRRRRAVTWLGVPRARPGRSPPGASRLRPPTAGWAGKERLGWAPSFSAPKVGLSDPFSRLALNEPLYYPYPPPPLRGLSGGTNIRTVSDQKFIP